MNEFFEGLCDIERDRATAAEICLDELLTIMDRHGVDGHMYSQILRISAELDAFLSRADGSKLRRERILRVRAGLTNAFPLTDADLAKGAALQEAGHD